MKTIHHWIIRSILALAVACLAAPARAQLVPDGGTNIVDGVFADGGVTNYIGSNAPFSLLVITNGGSVTNVKGVIGSTTNSVSNTVLVSGPGSSWSNSHNLVIGTGSYNQLIISNGGVVASKGGNVGFNGNNNSVTITGTGSLWTSVSGGLFIGEGGSGNLWVVSDGAAATAGGGYLGTTPVSSNNMLVVKGMGSRWTSDNLDVGRSGSGNQLVVSNGGVVAGSFGYLGRELGANNNAALVMGAGSRWAAAALTVGFYGSGNQLVVSNGGVAHDSSAGMGYYAASSNNVAVVTGEGSLWTNRYTLFVGGDGSGNHLIVSEGGVVQTEDLRLGLTVSSTGNRVSVNGATVIVTNASNTAALVVNRGTNVLNSGLIVTDNLVLTNELGVFEFNGGTLNVRTSTVANIQRFVVGNGTSAATFNATGTGSHTFANGLLIQTNATLSGTGTINGSVTNCGTIFLTNADQLIFTGPLVNKGVIIAVTGTPRFGSTFTNLGTLITTASINVANVSVSGDDIVLQFNSVSNYLHEVQASTNVSSGLWQSLTNGLLGTGSPITFTDPGGAFFPNRTYRVILH